MWKLDYPTNGLGQVGVVIWKKKEEVGCLSNNLHTSMCIPDVRVRMYFSFLTLVMNF